MAITVTDADILKNTSRVYRFLFSIAFTDQCFEWWKGFVFSHWIDLSWHCKTTLGEALKIKLLLRNHLKA